MPSKFIQCSKARFYGHKHMWPMAEHTLCYALQKSGYLAIAGLCGLCTHARGSMRHMSDL